MAGGPGDRRGYKNRESRAHARTHARAPPTLPARPLARPPGLPARPPACQPAQRAGERPGERAGRPGGRACERVGSRACVRGRRPPVRVCAGPLGSLPARLPARPSARPPARLADDSPSPPRCLTTCPQVWVHYWRSIGDLLAIYWRSLLAIYWRSYVLWGFVHFAFKRDKFIGYF